MEDTTALRAALVEALHKVDNPPQVEQPETVIKHALLACMEAYGPTLEVLERQAAELAKAKAEVERLRQYEPTLRDDEMRQLVCAPSELCWYQVIDAVRKAADQMVDCEDMEQFVELRGGAWFFVDLDADRKAGMNVARVREAAADEARAALESSDE